MPDWPWIRVLSVTVFCMLLIGVACRRRKRLHMSLMISAITIDLGIVLYLEIARGVVESIPKRPMTSLLFVHILLSVTVIVMYGVQVYGGIQNARGNRSVAHRKLMPWLLLIRFGNLVTSFFVV
ncbi:MAG: hypothetical protein IH987_09460 [Planctomycetes bacterium]|nr:hypothetical protein [Planctomycetota bacterium]